MQNVLPAGTNLALLGRKLLPAGVYQRMRDFIKSGPRVPVPEMPEPWRLRIAEQYGSGNRRLEARTGLPLKSLGYPVEC
jgi:hypothetical protein